MKSVAVAFPLHEGDRRKFRALAAAAGLPFPAIVPDSSAMPCVTCGMTLAVGPRVTAMVSAGIADVYCVSCGTSEISSRGGLGEVLDLGNPDSRPE